MASEDRIKDIAKNGVEVWIMSMDVLQEKIRKLKNPSVVDFSVDEKTIPPFILEEEEETQARASEI